MLEVKIDLIPFGQDVGREQIANIFIWNIAKPPVDEPRFEATYLAGPFDPRKDEKLALEHSVQVEHFRDEKAWVLVKKALERLEARK